MEHAGSRSLAAELRTPDGWLAMTFLRTYLRVLGLLAPEVRLAIALALANIALALAQFIEPILLGHIVDALSGTLPAAIPAAAAALAPLLGAWATTGTVSTSAAARAIIRIDSTFMLVSP